MGAVLSYCPDLDEVLDRLRRLYVERSQEIVLALMKLPSRTLEEFAGTHEGGFCEYPDPRERIRFWDAYLGERSVIRDDSVPSAYLTEMDQGLYGGLVGGDARFLCDASIGWISSMVAPILEDWSEFDRLAFDPECEWWRRYLRQLDVFAEGSRGKFGISHFILINGLNFVFELFGATRAYMDLIERPEMVGRAVEFALELNLRVQNAFFSKAPLIEGGTCSNMVHWMPGRIISESVDPFHMTSVDYFERWGRDVLEGTFSHFDGGVLHIHGNGRHLLEAVSSVKGLKAINLGDDRGYPAAFEVLGELRQRTADVPLVVSVGFKDFRRALQEHRLVGGVLYQVSRAPDLEAANRCMDLVREYKA
ncbi:MAG: hypothetical protein QGH74_07625 [Candidatus Brocadiia bacterium]|nr:hypothetical protein [Candidatus Brocadiia bacterium]